MSYVTDIMKPISRYLIAYLVEEGKLLNTNLSMFSIK